MANADRDHDWFASFQPIVSEAGATGATGATAAEKPKEINNPAAADLLHHQNITGATGATRSIEAVAPVAPASPSRCNTRPAPNCRKKQDLSDPVAPVALVAPENEARMEWGDDHEERAAIIEHDGGAPREWAEGFARLDCSAPPPGYSIRQWEQLINDGGRFLDRWAAEAIRLGWSAEDVFGVHPTAPGARVDAMGLVPLISGGEVVSITADRASIRTVSGRFLCYLRRPRPDAVALWELAS